MGGKFLVLRDTREQKGWTFQEAGPCLGTREVALRTGDYTLEGYESVFAVERKLSTAELAANVVDPRFERELERLRPVRHAYLVCEFTLDDVRAFPRNSGIPPSRWKSLRVTPQFLLKKLAEMCVLYGVKVVPAGAQAREWVASLFKRVAEHVERPGAA